MNFSKSFILCIVALLFPLYGTALELSDLKSVSSQSHGDQFVVSYEFDGPVSEKGIVTEFINQTIQLYIPGTKISKGKDFQSVSDGKVRSLYSYKLGKMGIRSRIIYNKPIEAKNFDGAVSFRAVGSRLDVIVRYAPMPPMDAVAMPKVVPSDIDDADAEKQLSPLLFEVDPGAGISAEEIVQRELGEEFERAEAAMKSKGQMVSAKARVAASKLKSPLKAVPALEKVKKATPKKMAKKESDVKLGRPVKEHLSESEIPVLLSAENKSKTSGSPFYRMFLSLIVVGVFGLGLVIFAKWWSKNSKKSLGDNHIRVLTQHHMGPKKSLAIVRVAGESILLGLTDHNISMIKTLSLIDEEVSGDVPDKFENALNSLVSDETASSYPEDIKDKVTVAQRESKPVDEYSYSQIKDLVSTKLKKMRTL